METYKIYWKDERGNIHHGSQGISFDLGSEWIMFLNKEYPYIKHWLEKVTAHAC